MSAPAYRMGKQGRNKIFNRLFHTNAQHVVTRHELSGSNGTVKLDKNGNMIIPEKYREFKANSGMYSHWPIKDD